MYASTRIAAAPPGVRPGVWFLMLAALALSTALATWRVRALGATQLWAGAAPAEARPAPRPAAGRVEPRGAPRLPPARPPRRDGETLETVRARLAAGPARTPAGEVDEWTVRLATAPGHREEMRRALRRMGRVEPVIRAALARERIPRDLLYLALVESSFAAAATSRVGAAGVWQFMPGTARGYGLEVGAWVDERRDPVRASFAAARHLRELHADLGGWHLAVAAYNCGSGCVRRALRRGGGSGGETPYWRIRPHLPRETREYVPRLLAAARIARDPAAFGFGAVEGAAPLAYRQILAPGGTALSRVARWAGAPERVVLDLNPHLVRGQTPPGRRWPVRVPVR